MIQKLKITFLLATLFTLPIVAEAQYPGPAKQISVTVFPVNNGWLPWWVNSDPFSGQSVQFNPNPQAVWNTPGWSAYGSSSGRGFLVPSSKKGTYWINAAGGYAYVRNP